MKRILTILFFLISNILYAVENNSSEFSVIDLKINATERNATEARKIAMSSGQREAFNKMLEKMNIDSSNSILISDEDILKTITFMQIKDEKITNNSYRATINVEFSQDYIKYILNKYKITKDTRKLDSYLIIPIFEDDEQVYYLDKKNKLLNSFNANISKADAMFVISENYFSEKIKISDIQSPSYSKFEGIIKFYNVNNLVVIEGKYSDTETIDIKISIINPQKKIKRASLKYKIENLSNSNEAFNKITLKIIDYLNESTEKDETFESKERNTIYIFTNITSLNNFNEIDSLLKSNKNIISTETKVFSKKEVLYFVKFKGTLDDLIYLLESDGFSVKKRSKKLHISYDR
jgi:hypothetical protein